MGLNKKPRFLNGVALRIFQLFVLITLFGGVLLLIFLLGTNSVSYSLIGSDDGIIDLKSGIPFVKSPILKRNTLSLTLENKNRLPTHNAHLYMNLSDDRIVIVLYVHNRPQYLKLVVESLSHVVGINETLLVVSHDGYFEEMNKIIEAITFCQVKQIFSPYSPHIFHDSFPGMSQSDCQNKDDPSKKHCRGKADQYGNYRSPRIVSLKHHWWWMMNTVWDGLKETQNHRGHILFIEEDHFIFPNAYRNLQLLTSLKPSKCPYCYAVNLAPYNINSRGEGWGSFVAERMGNVGYSFNRSVWMQIHSKTKEFCFFDDYNWDITMWATVYPSFGSPVYTFRGPRSSAVHFGKCGLHQGYEDNADCIDNGVLNIEVQEMDGVVNVKPEWALRVSDMQTGYQPGFRGWGGWGDSRDHQLCLYFSSMYHHFTDTSSIMS